MPVEPISPIVGVNDAGDIQLFPFVNLGDGSTVEGDPLSLDQGALRRMIN